MEEAAARAAEVNRRSKASSYNKQYCFGYLILDCLLAFVDIVSTFWDILMFWSFLDICIFNLIYDMMIICMILVALVHFLRFLI